MKIKLFLSVLVALCINSRLLLAEDSKQQLEEVLQQGTIKSDTIKKIPSWMLSSVWVSKNKAALLAPLTSKDSQQTINQEELKKILDQFLNQELQQGNFELPFTLTSFLKSKNIQIQGSVKRLSFADTNQDLSQKFREIIQISNPESLQHYRWTTFRFFRQPYDRVWILSPNIKQPRPVSSWLRSDSLFYTAISADDLLGSSELLNSFELTIADKLILLPKIKSPQSLKADSLMLDNPTPSFTVEADTGYSLTAVNKDPFAKIGKIEFILDSKTLVPIYKATFDRQGKQLSLLISALTDSNKISWSYKETLTSIATIMYGETILHSLDEWSPSMFDPYQVNVKQEPVKIESGVLGKVLDKKK